MSRETDFCARSGRQGILAVELRRGAGKARNGAPCPWGQIFQSYTRRERRASPLRDIEINPPLERKVEPTGISRLDIVRISGYYDLAGEDDELAEEAKEREWRGMNAGDEE